ncbi:hypothetical protein [Paenibacillus macerans]|uniref:hypothetical protein n=1 Tax=Paenibacillus macerans TaxID=44252 RepID=UPI003D3222EC
MGGDLLFCAVLGKGEGFLHVPIKLMDRAMVGRFPGLAKLCTPEDFAALQKLDDQLRRKGYSAKTRNPILGMPSASSGKPRYRWKKSLPLTSTVIFSD